MGGNNSKNYVIARLKQGDCLTVPKFEDCESNVIYYLLRSMATELLKGTSFTEQFEKDRPFVDIVTDTVENILVVELKEGNQELTLDVPIFDSGDRMRDVVEMFLGRSKTQYVFEGSYHDLMKELDEVHKNRTDLYRRLDCFRAGVRSDMDQCLHFAEFFSENNDAIVEKMSRRHSDAIGDRRLLGISSGDVTEFLFDGKTLPAYGFTRPPCEGWIMVDNGYAKENGISVAWDENCVDVVDKYKELCVQSREFDKGLKKHKSDSNSDCS